LGGADHGFFLGLDTSCYTTSVGIVNEQGMVVKDLRRILQVKSGERGLRQSEALFQHVKNIPQLLAEAVADTGDGLKLKAIGYSGRPRPREESYLPVFLAGENFGKALAYSAGVPAYPFTHQEGHIRAALVDTALRLTTKNKRFLGFHLSGGTTEVLLVEKAGQGGYHLQILGGTTDLHAGQMLDRLGVAMGLPFPAGRHLEELAKESLRQAEGRVGGTEPGVIVDPLPISVQDLSLSLSGPTSAAFRRLEAGAHLPDLAWAIQDCLLRSVAALLKNAVRKSGCRQILFFGGVASNSYLRQGLISSFPQLELYFARPELSTDNGVGIALLAWEYWRDAHAGYNVDY